MKREIQIHAVLRRLLDQRGLTTTQVAKATKVPNSTLSTWLLPKAKPKDPNHLAAVADFFGTTIDFLLFGEVPPVSIESLPLEHVLDGLYRLRLERVVLPKRKSSKEE